MSGHRWWTNARTTWIATTLVLVGCGQDAPPYDDLPLRDALRAAPEVVASLSFENRQDLARRLDAAGFAEDGATTLDLPDTVTIDSLSRVADEVREDQGHDALIVGEVVAEPSEFVVHGENIDDETLERLIVGPIVLRGRPGAQTAPFEETALRGRAGKWLRELSGRTNAKTMVRTTGLPFGAWAFEDKLYVNASWLVAMSALEEEMVAPVSVNDLTTGQTPKKNPLTVDYHPYNLPETIAECAQQVQQTCVCGTSCTHEVTDPTFTSATEECAWVNEDASHPAALCVLALMSIDDVRVCMESAGAACSGTSITTRKQAVDFVKNAACMDLLDICLRDGYLPQPSSGSGSSCDGVDCDSCSNCGNGCSNSNNSCSSCNDDCSSCNDDWSQCNDNCSDTNDNCSNTSSNAKSCGKCSVKPASEKSPLPAPFGSTLWLVAPAAYLWLRGRRRS